MSLTRFRAALLLTGVFLLGALCGGLLTGACIFHGMRGRGPFGHFFGGEKMQERMVRHLSHRLDLDPAQREVLEAAVARARADMDKVRDETVPRIQAIFDRVYDELAPVLRPEQRQELDKIRARTRERLFRHRGSPGPP